MGRGDKSKERRERGEGEKGRRGGERGGETRGEDGKREKAEDGMTEEKRGECMGPHAHHSNDNPSHF